MKAMKSYNFAYDKLLKMLNQCGAFELSVARMFNRSDNVGNKNKSATLTANT
jgi:hypothetical protein